eukprot:Skav234611  [mRNA]  locus=scaffold1110:370618:372077:- [translate_table: standard]
MDWSALRAMYRDEKRCKECNEAKPVAAFSVGRWKREDGARVCKECVRKHVDAHVPWQCMACAAWKQDADFGGKHANPRCTLDRVCKTCEKTQLCTGCKTRKGESSFSAGAWRRSRNGTRLCLECAPKAHGLRRCGICNRQLAVSAFGMWMLRTERFKGDQICDACHRPQVLRGIVRKAVRRMAATKAKVKEAKRTRAIAEVWEAIAAQKRRAADSLARTHRMAPPTRSKKTETMIRKRKHEEDEDAANAKIEERNKSKKAEDGSKAAQEKTVPKTDEKARQSMPKKLHARPTATAAPPAKQARETKTEKEAYQYTCPFCDMSVLSRIRTGQVDHRRKCGNYFRVKDGHVVTKAKAMPEKTMARA